MFRRSGAGSTPSTCADTRIYGAFPKRRRCIVRREKTPDCSEALPAACCRRYRPLPPSFDFFMRSTSLAEPADEPVVRVAAPDWPLSGLSMACPVGEVAGTLTPFPLELGCGAFGLFCAYAAQEALAASAMAMLMVLNFFI
jgi:hypothetical protein